jgi:hypothetical protein
VCLGSMMDERFSEHRKNRPGGVVARDGPKPFITRVVKLAPDGSRVVVTSRRHRKGLGHLIVRSPSGLPARTTRSRLLVWAPRRLGWWIAVLFTIGSALFAFASFLATWPQVAPKLSNNVVLVGLSYFIGSLFFTTAAYLQVLETINAGDSSGLYPNHAKLRRFRWFAWQPERIGYLASTIQLVGTLFFNVNTGNALISGLGWIAQDIRIWTPDILGSACFLASSYLAVMEVCHRYWAWQPRSLSWWIVFLNLVGSIAFGISAICSFVPPHPDWMGFTWMANFFTFVGAMLFLIASYLMLPEL